MAINTACEVHDVNKWGNPVAKDRIILGVFFGILVRVYHKLISSQTIYMSCVPGSNDMLDVR